VAGGGSGFSGSGGSAGGGAEGGEIYRSGGRSPSELQHGVDVSFRDSLSEPWPQGSSGPVFNKREYIVVDTKALPPGSVVYDHNPPGHVTVNAPVRQIKDAVVRKDRFPR
jgi:hypothetical protein